MDSENNKTEELKEEETSLKTAETDEVTEKKEEAPLPKPIFVARTVLDGDSQLEGTKTTTGKSAAIVSYAMIALCAVMIVALIVAFFTSKNSSNLLMAGLLLLCMGFVIYNMKIAPKKAVQRWENDMIRMVGEPRVHLLTEFYDLSMIQTVEESPDNMVDAGYSEIKTMKESEHLFLLKASGRQWFMIAKDGFTVGDAESFRKFIQKHMEEK